MPAAFLIASVLAQQTESFSIALDAPAAEAMPLFGPVREAEWTPGWSPRFVHPQGGAAREGTIFTTTVGKAERPQLWVLTEYDANAGRIAYVVVESGFMVTEIKIHVDLEGSRCRATVTYRRSALDPSANAIVEALDVHWAAAQGPHWQAAINAALVRGRAPLNER